MALLTLRDGTTFFKSSYSCLLADLSEMIFNFIETYDQPTLCEEKTT